MCFSSEVEVFTGNARVLTQTKTVKNLFFGNFWNAGVLPTPEPKSFRGRSGTAPTRVSSGSSPSPPALHGFMRALGQIRRRALARRSVKDPFAQTQRFWRGFHQFVFFDVFDRALQAHPQRSLQLYPFT